MSEYIFLKMYKKKGTSIRTYRLVLHNHKGTALSNNKKKHPTWALSNAATAKLSNTHKREKYLEGNIV